MENTNPGLTRHQFYGCEKLNSLSLCVPVFPGDDNPQIVLLRRGSGGLEGTHLYGTSKASAP